MSISQVEIQKVRNEHKEKCRYAKEVTETTGKQAIYKYKSLAINKRYNKFIESELFSIEYQPNPFQFQYDLEVFIFLNYDLLKAEELELTKNKEFVLEYGATGFPREEHLLNAINIRWPTKILPTGEHSGLLVRNPWLEDFCTGLATRSDVVVWGGGGQGKTYGFLGFMCILFDHFYYTKSGAQCSYSTTSEDKLKNSTWAYVTKIYPVDPRRPRFSLYAGHAKKAPDYEFRRLNSSGKYVDEGGKFKGVLLQKGIKDSRVTDKLTGVHDPIARIYLLDEAQTTDGAPLNAYTNMFMHPKYGWFGMSGNYELPTDLLGINVEPNVEWENINKETHIYEGTLKSPTDNLGRTTYIIHYNNDHSPGMTEEGAKKWPFLPNAAKKKKLYPTEEARETYAYKRFWIGYRFEKEDAHAEYLFNIETLVDYKAMEPAKLVDNIFTFGSFDSAPASRDRNIYRIYDLGISGDTGFPCVSFRRILTFPKSSSQLKYYDDTCNSIVDTMDLYGIQGGHQIMDWSSKTALVEMLNTRGRGCQFIMYHGRVPDGKFEDSITKKVEPKIELESIQSFIGTLEKKLTHYAHEKVKSRIVLGAYIMRMFLEKGCIRNWNSKLLDTVPKHQGFEKEFLKRKLVMEKTYRGELLNLDDKDDFIKQYHFSPDILDCDFQFFYMIYVLFGVRPDRKTLGVLQKNKNAGKRVNKLSSLWDLKVNL